MSRLAPLAALAVLLGGCALAPLRPFPLPPEAEVVRARTEDGWTLALIRYRPVGEPSGPPVLLCHGISANGRNMDLDEGHSLARFLAGRGRETFALSLRGNGESDRPDPERGRPVLYSMDTYAEQDLPAALARVRELTGAPRVDYVGHSMGGLIGYNYLARGGQGVHALVTLGSPARFAWGRDLERVLRRAGEILGDDLEYVDVPLLAKLTLPLHGNVQTALDQLLYNPDNVPPDLWRRFISTGVGSISGGVLRQFTLWLERDAMVSADGGTDYTLALGKVTVPALIVAGKGDRIAPAAAVKAGYEALGGPKVFFVAGEENGFVADYGHMDLVIGERAAQELWPRIADFLDGHRPR